MSSERARRLRLPRDKTTWLHLTVAALIANAIPFLLFAIGEPTVSSSLAGALNATTPLWTLGIGLAALVQQRSPAPASTPRPSTSP